MTTYDSDDRDGMTLGQVTVDIIKRLASNGEVYFKYVRTVRDFMNTEYEPITLDHSNMDAWRRFQEDRFADLPVVDMESREPAGKIHIGTIRKRDMALGVTENFDGRGQRRAIDSISQSQYDEKMLQQKLGSMVSRKIKTLEPDTGLVEAVNMMLKDDVECFAVVGYDQEFLGCLSNIDVLQCFSHLKVLRRAREDDSKNKTRFFDMLSSKKESYPIDVIISTFVGRAKEVMNPNPVTMQSDEKIRDAIKLMQDNECTSVCVLDRNKRVKGLVTQTSVQLALPNISTTKASSARESELFVYDEQSNTAASILGYQVTTAMETGDLVAPDESLTRVAELLCESERHTLPVVDESRSKLLGTISRNDLLQVVIVLAELAAKRQSHE